MTFGYCFSVCLFGILTVATVEAIVAGRATYVNQFPYQVAVFVGNFGHVCGGGIIGDQFVITAAHCVVENTSLRSKDISILAGTNDLNQTNPPALRVRVDRVFFSSTLLIDYIDIALLRLADSLQLSRNHGFLRKLKYPLYPHPEETATIAGFGLQTYHNRTSYEHSNELRYASVTVIRDNSCERYYRGGSLPYRIQVYFCAHMRPPPFYNSLSPYGVCRYDQGSPLVYNGAIVGILTRRAPGCNERFKPALYVRVSHFTRSIRSVIEHSRAPGVTSLDV